MIKAALIPPYVNPKLVSSYIKNFNQALVNWELNRNEDQPPDKKGSREDKLKVRL